MTRKEKILANFIAENMHVCPLPEMLYIPNCKCWGSEECANCIYKYADFLKGERNNE